VNQYQAYVVFGSLQSIAPKLSPNPKPDRTPHKSNTIETLKPTIATPNYKMLNLRDRKSCRFGDQIDRNTLGDLGRSLYLNPWSRSHHHPRIQHNWSTGDNDRNPKLQDVEFARSHRPVALVISSIAMPWARRFGGDR
jgi:hypothetical protein